MPDTRSHRGIDPRDGDAFAPGEWEKLRSAVADLSWLHSRAYAEPSALKLVGDRHGLTARQRDAVRRSACSDAALRRRLEHRVTLDRVRGLPLGIDGFNVLTTIETALGGGVILVGRDGSFRDLAGVHGTYRKVEETRPALLLLGNCLERSGIGPCAWYLDSPVSNSGRLRGIILELAQERGWPWQVELVFNPDPILAASPEPVATADSAILDRCHAWVPLTRAIIEAEVSEAFVVDLSDSEGVSLK
ncbi:MAG TPA: DUF434 domain-containing protein [Isosphaeraceae bacterium]|jgi:hypothetical protein|nr:DUF434 domain-containing protein [Isosphaeraceae bacterium]